MFKDMLLKWVEPSADSFNAYFYDVGGACYDFSIVPEFLREYMEYPEYGSGTCKYLYLLYKFASRAKLAIECGVYTGISTIALSKGLESNGGSMISIDLNLTRPLLHERVQKHNIKNVQFVQGNNLGFRFEKQNCFDLIYIDSDHTYEHAVKELFLFDKYLKPGGIVIMHDIVVPQGIGLIESKEDYGYVDGEALINKYIESKDKNLKFHISEYPVCKPATNCLNSPIYLAIQTFLSYRPNYKLFKNIDFAGIGIIWKLPY